MDARGELTSILSAASSGDGSASRLLLPLVYDELRKLAAHALKGERRNHTLQPTELAHEAWMRMVDQTRADLRERTHFMGVAAEMIRRILVDHARKRRALKRGGDHAAGPVAAEQCMGDAPWGGGGIDLLALDEALTQLGALSHRQRRVVELRFFGGLGVVETAEVLKISPATVKDDWRLARAWLRQRLRD